MNAPAQVVQVEENFEDEVIEVENTTEEHLSSRDKIAKDYAEKEAAKHDPEPIEEIEPEPEPKEVEVIINGAKKMVAKEKVDQAGGVEIYQKSLAANQGLQELAEQRRALQREREEFERYRTQGLPQADSKQSVSADAQNLPNADGKQGNISLPGDSDDTAELVKRYHEAIIYGEQDDEVGELFDQIMTKRAQQNATQVDYDKIKREAAAETRKQIKIENWQDEVSKAKGDFAENFPDLAGDTRLFNAADQKTAELLQQHPDWAPGKIIEEAGNQVREWLSGLKGQSASTSRDEKVAQKQNTRSVKTAAGRAKAKPAPKQQTNSEYILAERKRRGLE